MDQKTDKASQKTCLKMLYMRKWMKLIQKKNQR